MKAKPFTIVFLCVSLFGGFHNITLAATTAKTIKIVAEPFEPSMGPNLPGSGFLSEVVRESFKQVGIEVKINFIPWARAVQNTKTGTAEALMGAYHTKELAVFLEYSHELGEVKGALFTRKGTNVAFTTLEDLRGFFAPCSATCITKRIQES